jgi:hypothetical protein
VVWVGGKREHDLLGYPGLLIFDGVSVQVSEIVRTRHSACVKFLTRYVQDAAGNVTVGTFVPATTVHIRRQGRVFARSASRTVYIDTVGQADGGRGVNGDQIATLHGG